MTITAKLRVCASCEWVFRSETGCPKCGFCSYGARYVYGQACYRYAKTQEPWKQKKMARYAMELDAEIRKATVAEVITLESIVRREKYED